jgi:NADPH-dependent 2,4-dienoyl-CoA reductase/sulfur reductase-like enzyme
MANYLIVGNGVAGATAAENIRKLDKDGTITVVTEEDLFFITGSGLMNIYPEGSKSRL